MDRWHYVYPPFFASALALGPSVSYEVFARAWLVVLLIGYWMFAACIGKMALGVTTLKGTLVAGAILHFFPGVYQALNMGQADILIWAMVGLAFAYPSWRGVGFMAAALVKVHAIWPLAVAMWREGKGVLRSSAATMGAAVGLAALALGPMGLIDSSVEWFTRILPNLSQGQFDLGDLGAILQLPSGLGEVAWPGLIPLNLSLSFAPLQMAYSFGGWTPDPGNLPMALRFYLSFSSVAAPILAGWLFRKYPVDLHCSLVLSAALLFSPILRVTYLPILLLPAVIYFSGKRGDPNRPVTST
jgi:hypothetical protein